MTSKSKPERAVTILRRDGPRELLYRLLVYLGNKLRAPNHGEIGEREKAIRRLVDTDSPRIVDGGANRGQTIHLFQTLFDNPEIIAVEPIPDLAESLAATFGDDVTVHNTALGEVETVTDMNIAKKSGQSSILNPSKNVDMRHGGEIDQVIQVDIARLDNLVSGSIDILKLDLQGYELNALRGATNLLESTDILLVEVEFIPLYEGADTFCDIHQFLEKYGFELYNFFSLEQGPDGRLEWGDAVYVRI